MKVLKRSVAIMATLAMALSISIASVFAVDIGTGVVAGSATEITVPKGVTFINKDNITSYGPGITYTYTLEPAAVTDGAMTVTDASGNSTTVHAGPTGGLTLVNNSVTFASTDRFGASATGVEDTKDIVMNVDTDMFDRAGVYRYVLTDTTATSALFEAGVTRADGYDTTRYIDVFIKRGTSGMEVAGYALKTDNTTTVANTPKDPGFVANSSAEGSDTDKYATYNLTLTKQVEGAYGDTEHEFPFAITISNQGKKYFVGKGTISETAETALETTLKHGESYTIQGLSPKATVAYQETNDTTDLYSVTVEGSTESITVNANDTAKTYAVAASDVSTYTSNTATNVSTLGLETNCSSVTYTNTLEEVSPTGFVQHYGLMAMLLIFGSIMLIMASKVTKDEEL